MSKIAEIHTITFRLPLKGALSWGKASRLDVLEHVLVRLVTDTGHVGLAEAPPRPTIYGETPESIHTIIQKYFAPKLMGMDVADIEGVNQQMATIANNHTAKGAIDICLHQALAASQGQSLLDYLNPPNRKIRVSYILGIADRATILTEAKTVYDQGVRVFKVKVGRNFNDDLARIRELQTEFKGSDLYLYADANQGLAPNQAQLHLQQLADLGILYLEEPLPVEMLPERATLHQAEILPLIADDSVFTPPDLARELHFDTFDILNIKTARTGYYHSKQMLSLAEQHDKGVMVGSQASSTLGALRAAIFAGLDGIDYPSELSFFLKLEDDIVNRPIQIVDGYIGLDTLGGITLDEERLRNFRVDSGAHSLW
jgi:L-alanine-DL-glutamate epimerase-like enolase superfamily enzyme